MDVPHSSNTFNVKLAIADRTFLFVRLSFACAVCACVCGAVFPLFQVYVWTQQTRSKHQVHKCDCAVSCPYYFSHSACVNSFMFSLSFASPICSCMFVFVLLFYSTHYNHYKSFVINLSTANYIITTTTLHTYWLGSLAIPPGSCNLWQSLSYCSMGPTHGIVPANGHRS